LERRKDLRELILDRARRSEGDSPVLERLRDRLGEGD